MNFQTQLPKWGVVTSEGAEVWDTEPVFRGARVTRFDWVKLLFYPKKWMLYRYITKTRKHENPASGRDPAQGGDTKTQTFRILDVGCGTGAAVIDLKKIFGETAEVIGIDVVRLQIDLARQKFQRYGVVARAEWYDGNHIPFPDNYFDAIYTSDVLGHVSNVPAWLDELQRVLKPGGALAMFSESKLGRHAWIRRYLFNRGLNVDPHAQFHISLYSKSELSNLVQAAGFSIKKMYGIFWAAFFWHPEEFYPALQSARRFPILRRVNALLYWLKCHTRPVSTALAEIYGLVEMLTVGRFVESQGYVILATK